TERKALIGGDTSHLLSSAIRPGHQYVRRIVRAQPEAEDRLHGREVAPAGLKFLHEPVLESANLYTSAHPERVWLVPLQANPQVSPLQIVARRVAIEERFAIDVIDHQVQISIQIEIRIRGAVRERRLVQNPVGLFKQKAVRVPKDVV